MAGLAVVVDFTGVEEGGGAVRIPAGDYVFKVAKVDKKQKQGSDYPYLNWKLMGVNGAAKNVTMYEVTTLNPAGLFNLYNFLVALGIEVPKKKVQVPLDKCIGKYLGCVLEDEEYTGKDGKTKTKSGIVSFFGVKKNSKGQWEKTGGADEIEPNEPDEIPDEELDDLDNIEPEDEGELELEKEEAPQKPVKSKAEKPKTDKKPKTEKPKKETPPPVEDDDLDAELAALEAELEV